MSDPTSTEKVLRSKLAFICMAAVAGKEGDLKTLTDDLVQWFGAQLLKAVYRTSEAEAKLTAAYEADLHARGQKTIAEVRNEAAIEQMTQENAQLREWLSQVQGLADDLRAELESESRHATTQIRALNQALEANMPPDVAELSRWLDTKAALFDETGIEDNKFRRAANALKAMAVCSLRERLEGEISEGWKEATIAWACCASIHREYAKGRDALYTTRQADFVRHEGEARAAIAKATGEAA